MRESIPRSARGVDRPSGFASACRSCCQFGAYLPVCLEPGGRSICDRGRALPKEPIWHLKGYRPGYCSQPGCQMFDYQRRQLVGRSESKNLAIERELALKRANDILGFAKT